MWKLSFVLLLLAALSMSVRSQEPAEIEIAAKYAPIFHQALGEYPRGDYPTNFDFDGDWIGTNNWAHAEDRRFKLRGFIYYSVTETVTHYYIHYAVFHARDYKGGTTKGVIYSDLLWLGAKILSRGKDPSGKLEEAAIAHENDMEGALVVVEKSSQKVVFLETLHHNRFSRYVPGGSTTVADGFFRASNGHVELYVEPRGHGIAALGTERPSSVSTFATYSYTGTAGDPEVSADRKVGYDLLPIATTLWAKVGGGKKDKTYASQRDFGTVKIGVVSGDLPVTKDVEVGVLPVAFDGQVGGVNVARPPWGWISNDHRDDPPGSWYFDPARIVKRDFGLDDSFSTAYVTLPFWAQSASDTSTTAEAASGH
jgi:hypothetical protein